MLKIATLHCFGSNPHKHATQRSHFVHCVEACGERAEWLCPPAPHRVASEVVYDLLKHRMGCTDEEVAAFGFEDPRCWFRSTDDGYLGLEASMDYLAELCARERPDGIAGYSNGAGAALLVAAARESGQPAFQSIRFLMSFAGPTSPAIQQHIRDLLGPARERITLPTLIFGSRRDPMLVNAEQMASDLFERCELALSDEPQRYANHALPEAPERYETARRFLDAREPPR